MVMVLFGSEKAIRQTLVDDWALPAGIILVLNAGLASTYDRYFLLKDGYLLFVPLLASIVIAVAIVEQGKRDGYRNLNTGLGTPPRYRQVWSCVMLVALIVTLGGFPLELILERTTTMKVRPAISFAVFIWTLFVLARIQSVCANMCFPTSMARTLSVFCLGVIVRALIPPYPRLGMPGGLLVFDSEGIPEGGELIFSEILPLVISTALLPICLVVACFQRRAIRRDIAGEELVGKRSSRRQWKKAMILGGLVFSVVAWSVAFARWQPQQARRCLVMKMFSDKRYSEALELMASREEKDFPSRWRPPPRVMYSDPHPDILEIVEIVAKKNIGGWVREHYIRELRRHIGPPHRFRPEYHFGQIREIAELERVTQLLEQMPEGPWIVKEYSGSLGPLLGSSSSDLTNEERRLLERWVALIPDSFRK